MHSGAAEIERAPARKAGAPVQRRPAVDRATPSAWHNPTFGMPPRTPEAVHLLADVESTFNKEDVVAGPPAERPRRFTPKQGQYLTFIYYYSKIHGTAPAESDFRRFFRVTPPVVHQMILTLEARGLIERRPGKARSIRLLLTRAELPDLE